MKILLHGPITLGPIDKLKKLLAFPCQIKTYNTCFTDQHFLKDLSMADVLVTMELPDFVLFPSQLKLIQITGVGVNHIDFSKIPKHIPICVTPGHEEAIVEYILMTMLIFLRNLKQVEESFKKHSWEMGACCGGHLQNQLANKKIGILGYGKIGQNIAKQLKPFGVKNYVCNRTPVQGKGIDKFFNLQDLNKMLKEVDFLIVSLALTPETQNIINKRSFELMKSQMIIINVARGPCIDEKALFDACKEKKIKGAVLDVWYKYPTGGASFQSSSQYPFESLDNVIMTPHISAWTEETMDKKIKIIATNIKRIASGKPLLNLSR